MTEREAKAFLNNLKVCIEEHPIVADWLVEIADRKTEPMKTTDYCDICKRDMCEDCIADATNPYCVPSHYEINYEPKTEQTEPQTEDKCKGCIYENGDSLMACVSCQGKVPYAGYEWDEPQTEEGER